MTIFNQKQIDYTKQPMFFGEDLSVQTYTEMKYPAFDKLTERQLSYFWRPQEIDLSKDRVDYAEMDEVQQHIFTSNLKYQILLDSVQGRGPITAFLPVVSLPELEACMVWWDAFEVLHSRSYTYMIKNLYANPDSVFSSILNTEEIVERASNVTKYYDEFIWHLHTWQATPDRAKGMYYYQLQKRLYLALIAVYILEGLRFYTSFACTYAFGELNLMEGSASIIKLINRDEMLHMSITQHILNLLREREGEQWNQIAEECTDEVLTMFKNAVEDEQRWAKYLFKDGTIIGLNERLLSDYIEWLANKRLNAIRLPKLYDKPLKDTANPLPWTANWMASKAEQVAPQELEITQYMTANVNKNKTKSFKKMEL